MITIKFCARYLSISISILGSRELITLFIIPSKAHPFLVINEGGKRMEDFDWKIEQTLYLTIFGAEFGASTAEYGPIRKKL